jgi:hypothetical protein
VKGITSQKLLEMSGAITPVFAIAFLIFGDAFLAAGDISMSHVLQKGIRSLTSCGSARVLPLDHWLVLGKPRDFKNS